MSCFASAAFTPEVGDGPQSRRAIFCATAALLFCLSWLAPLPVEASAPISPSTANAATDEKPVMRGDYLRQAKAPVSVDGEVNAPAIQLPPARGFDGLQSLFEDRRHAMADGDVNRVHEIEREIAALRDELDIDNLFSFSAALLVEARSQLDANPAEARRKALLAAELSPSLAQPHWVALLASWKARESSGIGLSALAVELWAATKASFREPYGEAARHMDLILVAPVLAIAIALALLVIALFRSAGLLLHDLAHLAPRGVRPIAILPLLLLLSALLWIEGFGLLGPIAFLGLLIIPYASAGERAALSISLLLLAAMPTLVSEVSERLPILDADAQALYFIDRSGPEGGHMRAQEMRLAEESEHAYAASYILGRKALRGGEYARAIPLLRQATRLNQSASAPWIAIGNAYLFAGDLERAFENYTRARQHDPKSAEAAFNLSSYYLRKAQLSTEPEQTRHLFEQARSMFDEAAQLNPALARAPLDMRANHFVLTAPLDVRALAKNARQEKIAADLGGRVTGFFFGTHARQSPVKVTITILALWLLYGLGRLLVPVTRPCFKCGAPACNRCEHRSPSPGLCADCFSVFGQPGRPDSTACARREWQIQRRQKWRQRAILVSALLIPGSGAMWRGKALRGALGLVFACLLVLLVAFPGGFFPSPFDALPPLIKRVPAIALIVLLWSQSFLSTRRALRAQQKRNNLSPLGKLR